MDIIFDDISVEERSIIEVAVDEAGKAGACLLNAARMAIENAFYNFDTLHYLYVVALSEHK